MTADAPVPAGGRERRTGGRRSGRKEKRASRGGVIAFLLVSALPVAGLVWFFLQPEERRQELLDLVPAGVGGRLLSAAIAFGLLIVLARVALPAFHGTSAALRGVLTRMRARPPALRALLFPVELLVGLLWFVVQLLFAIDAFLILATALIGLLLIARVVKPDLLPNVLPQFAETQTEEAAP